MSNHIDEDVGIFHRLILLCISALIGMATVGSVFYMHSRTTGQEYDLSVEYGFFIVMAAMVSFPFAVLSLLGISRRLPWLVGLFLTFALWGWDFYDGVANWGTGRGANIGLGLLLTVSPALIAVACLIAARYAERRGNRRSRLMRSSDKYPTR